MPAHCKACGAEILFQRTEKGKMMPVEIFVTTVLITEAGVGRIVRGHVPHFVNCPQAAKFKGGQNAKTE